MIKLLQDRVKLNNGRDIPGLGLGVYKMSNDECENIVREAIKFGYRLIDTASFYDNEVGTGKGINMGIREAGIKREDVFVTTKVWNYNMSYDDTIKSFNSSLERLNLDYLDLYLIHWPGVPYAFEEPWKALEHLYDQGKIKSIGISNFNKEHIDHLLSFAKVKPVLNQIELHPKLTQKELRKYGEDLGILPQAWSPLTRGMIFEDELIVELCKKYNKTPAQIILRWHLQENILVIFKTANIDRLVSNVDIFDFDISDEDMKRISDMNENLRTGPDPSTFNFGK